MSAPRCYLDYNATTPLRPGARAAMVAVLEATGNPSSIHAEGRAARRVVEQARAQVAALVGAAADAIVFTAGATEGAALALSPTLAGPTAPRGVRRLLVCATEHAAVRHGHRFAEADVTVLPVDRHGVLRLDALASALADDGGSPALLALQAANNETGVLQPTRVAAQLVHAAGGLLVCDAVQMAGRMPFGLEESGADVALLSSHKIGGPQGVGAVALAPGVVLGAALVRGGGQERGARSGTENVAGIAGFGAATLESRDSESDRLAALQHRLEHGLAALDAEASVFGGAVARLPNTTAFAVPGMAAETLLIALDLAGLAVSSGSACASGKVARSHVLDAMGVPAILAQGALRLSTGWASTAADIDRFLTAFDVARRRMRKGPLPIAA
ncbi:cysteine desulfurase family protein [Lichenihabitans sp. Uapishka_5]|uniref:cysteine desulfurase family protein n=1 Tax=Lichenihabitans sp. Uapishka_5 TaxID=3037302 RepID=UPI0029E7E4A3|nr:cysteine desulfurase family protein [Lichenihabitans sp. Uapishka_5]MDX7950038.1 cysteine desulfurase family protein [Lichenihabitans sp. Uapishka_5]